MVPGKRGREHDTANAGLDHPVTKHAADSCPRHFAAQVDFDLRPRRAGAAGNAKALEYRFLGRPYHGELLRRVLSRLAPAQFIGCVNPLQKAFAVLLDHGPNASAFDDFGAESHHVHDDFPSDLRLADPRTYNRTSPS